MRISLRFVLVSLLVAPVWAQRPEIDPLRPHVLPGLGTRALEHSFVTDFETTVLGEIDGQENWLGNQPGAFTIVDSPAQEQRALRSGTDLGQGLAMQTFGLGNVGGGTVSWDWYFDGSTNNLIGAEQQIVIQPNLATLDRVITRIRRFYETQRLQIFTSINPNAGIWIDLGFDIPHNQWVNFRIELFADRTFDVYIDDVYIRSGIGFTDKLEEFVVFNDGFGGNTMYVDNVRIYCPQACQADLDQSGMVDLSDLAMVLSSFGSGTDGDINGDGTTDLTDLAELLAYFGAVCA